jgi:hypothetical protein
VHLDVTGGQLGIAHVRGTGDDVALDEENGLRTHRLRARQDFGGRPARPKGDLDQAVAIAQIEEHDAAKVAAPVDPAAQLHLLSDVLLAKLAAAMGSLGCPSHAFASVYAPPISASHRIR